MIPQKGQIWKDRRTGRKYYIYNIWPNNWFDKECVIFSACRKRHPYKDESKVMKISRFLKNYSYHRTDENKKYNIFGGLNDETN